MTINYTDLERFRVPRKVRRTTVEEDGKRDAEAADNEPRSSTAQEPENDHPLTRIHSKWTTVREPGNEPPSEELDAAPTPSNPISVITVKNPKRVLDNHAAIFAVFDNAFFLDKRRSQRRDLSIYKHDKWYDQFDGLKAAVSVPEKKASGLSGKRKGEEDEQSGSNEGTRKRIRGLTYRMNIPRTVIEQSEPAANSSDAVEDEET